MSMWRCSEVCFACLGEKLALSLDTSLIPVVLGAALSLSDSETRFSHWTEHLSVTYSKIHVHLLRGWSFSL